MVRIALIPSLFLASWLAGCAGPSGATRGDGKPVDPTRIAIRARGGEAQAVDAHTGRRLRRDADLASLLAWSMERCDVTIVEAGSYTASERIVIPRSGVRLVIEQDATIEFAADTRSPGLGDGDRRLHALIYVHGHDDVRILHFGELVAPADDRAWVGILLDGRNLGGSGVDGATIASVGTLRNVEIGSLVVDAHDLRIPVFASTSHHATAVMLEGCEDTTIGCVLQADLEPPATTALDLHGANEEFRVDTVFGTAPSIATLDIHGSSDGIVERVSCFGTTEHIVRRTDAGSRWMSEKTPVDNANLLVLASDQRPLPKRWELSCDVPRLGADGEVATLEVLLEGQFEDGVQAVFTETYEIRIERP